MARRAKGGRLEVIIALIGLAGVVLAALIANWNEIFWPEPPPAPAAGATAATADTAGTPPMPTTLPTGEVPVNSLRNFTEAQKNALDANTRALEDIAAQISGASANESAPR